MAIKISSHFSVHPGVWLREEMVDPNRLSVTDIAKHFNVSRQAMSMLLNGRTGLTAEMAIRFEKAFGLQADTLCRMQSAHDLALARAHQDDIKVMPLALGSGPINFDEMVEVIFGEC